MVEKGKEGWEEMGRNGSDREVEGGCGGRTQRDREGWAPVRSGGRYPWNQVGSFLRSHVAFLPADGFSPLKQFSLAS